MQSNGQRANADCCLTRLPLPGEPLCLQEPLTGHASSSSGQLAAQPAHLLHAPRQQRLFPGHEAWPQWLAWELDASAMGSLRAPAHSTVCRVWLTDVLIEVGYTCHADQHCFFLKDMKLQHWPGLSIDAEDLISLAQEWCTMATLPGPSKHLATATEAGPGETCSCGSDPVLRDTLSTSPSRSTALLLHSGSLHASMDSSRLPAGSMPKSCWICMSQGI